MKRPLFAVTLCLVAVTWIKLATGGYDNSPEWQPEDKAILQITGQICQKEDQKIWLDSVTFCISNQSIQINHEFPFKVICETEKENPVNSLPMGTTVMLQGKYTALKSATNPGEFDEKKYYQSLGVGGKLNNIDDIAHGQSFWPVRETAFRLRCFFKQRIYQCMSEEKAGVMSALLLGDKSELDRELKDLYKRNGILHILSISSLHITIIGMSLYQALRKVGIPIIPAALLGGTVLLFYGLMTGFSVSATRAIGMYLIRMFAEICGRTYDMLTALGVMALVMVLGNPYRLQNSGFLLSFSAVFGVGILRPVLEEDISLEREKNWEKGHGISENFREYGRKGFRALKTSLVTSLSITLVTLPIQLWFYYEVPIFSPILNLFVLPCMKPLLIAGFLSLLPGVGFLGKINEGILSFFDLLCEFFDEMYLRTWNPGQPDLWRVVCYYVIIVLIVVLSEIWKAGKIRRNSMKWLLLFCNVLLLTFPVSHSNKLGFLDVGQGDCILIQTATGENILFDCGSSSRKYVGKNVLLPCLKYYGIRQLDAVIVSHPDKDHMNGIQELIEFAEGEGISVKQLVLPGIEQTAREHEFGELLQMAESEWGSRCKVRYLAAGDSWTYGKGTGKEIRFQCLHPEMNMSGEDSNAYSLCVLVSFGRTTCLLTGDVESEGERNLTERLAFENQSEVTILKCAHHGSRNATSADLLWQIAPKTAIISCGRNNRYGHPHEEVLARLQDTGAGVFRTDEDGAILVTIDEKRGNVKIRRFGSLTE